MYTKKQCYYCGLVNIELELKICPNCSKPLDSRGHKTCECGTSVGVRTRICPTCGKTFVKKTETPKNNVVKPDGRGKKVCIKCKTVNGVRSTNCCKCGAGFKIKGVQYGDVHPEEVKLKKPTLSSDDTIKFSSLFLVDEPRPVDIKYYGKAFKAWISVCGKYRIAFCKYFMGVQIDAKVYKLFYKSGIDWMPCKGKHRFRSFRLTIRSYLKRIRHDSKENKKIVEIHPVLAKAISKLKTNRKTVKR